jgi:hypothetical protein
MRQALGLRNGSPGHLQPQRREQDQRGRRFVKDGEVPVVLVNSSREHGGDAPPPVNRIAQAENALRAERGAREHAERALIEAQTAIQHLRTKLAHAEMAHSEALAAERAAREAAETSLREAIAAREAAEARANELAAAPPRAARARFSAEAASGEFVVRSRAPRKPREPAAPEQEPEPVQWWLPSFRAKSRKG